MVLNSINIDQIGQAVLGVLIIFGYIGQRLKIKEADNKLQQVYILSNSRLESALRRIDQLETKLKIPQDEKFSKEL